MKPDLNPYKKHKKRRDLLVTGTCHILFLDFVLINLEGKD